MSDILKIQMMVLGGAVALLGAIAVGADGHRAAALAQLAPPASIQGNAAPPTTAKPTPVREIAGDAGKGILQSVSTTGRNANPALQAQPVKSPVPSHKPSDVTAVVLAGGEQRGSAVVLAQALGGSWLVTNRHVVDGESNVCVRSADGRLWPGVTVLPRQAGDLDVAFLWLPEAIGLPSATPAPQLSKVEGAWGFPIVRAAGYPVDEQSKAQPPTFRELRGLLLPLLPKPLEGGMQLATTAAVRKGMSGGGLFDGEGLLVGLTTTHADPLWPAPLREEGGKALSLELNQRLELVALAIPLSRIISLVRRLEPPVMASQPPRKMMTATERQATEAGHQSGSWTSVAAICSGYLL